MPFERQEEKTVWEGKIASVRVVRVRFDDGEEAEREVVSQPGAVAVVAHDGERVYMVRQPREPVDEQSLLELPAGKLDEEGEEVVDTARRELGEEIGKAAETWEHITSFYTSPGISDEEAHLYLATDLRDEKLEAEENERIEVVEVLFEQLDDVIAQCSDAKTLIGLLWLKAKVLSS